MTAVVRLLSSMLGEVRRVIEVDREHDGSLHSDLEFIAVEMQMVKGNMVKYQGAAQKAWILLFQELAYDVEDFVEGLWQPGNFGRVLLVAAGLDPRSAQLQEIKSFKHRIESLKDWQPSAAHESSEGEAGAAVLDAVKGDTEVIDGPKKHLVDELILPPDSPAGLRVISILGCRGVGKTTLARAIYTDANVRSQFKCFAWFNASKAKDVLAMAPEEDKMQTAQITNLGAVPDDKRILIVIDDVHQPKEVLQITKELRESKMGSRIILTTSVRSVADACSSGSYYVYTMTCLDKSESRKLFWRKVYGTEREPSPAVENGSESIFTKCDGLPLALDSTAKDLSIRGNRLEGRDCEEAGEKLGIDEEMQKALIQSDHSDKRFPTHDHRACLLYLSTLPRGYWVKSKCLVRRWMAEGLVYDAEEGSTCLDMLTDHCIIDPVQLSSDSRDAKRHRVHHGLLLECIIQEAVSKNIVTLIQDERVLKSRPMLGIPEPRIRRLSVQSRVDEVTCDWSRVRSLTIFNSVFYFWRYCNILRLLDLEGCTWVKNDHLYSICKMPLLKYLSLRNSGINMLPTQIKNLQRLETLDVRKSTGEMTIILPIEAIMLPKLAYLFGKFELPAPPKKEKELIDFLSIKSELQVLSGFNFNQQSQGPELYILYARNLKKIKVWCSDASADTSMTAPDTGLASSSRSSGGSSHHLSSNKRQRRNSVFSQRTPECPNLLGHCHKKPQKLWSDNFDIIGLLRERSSSLESLSIYSKSGLSKGLHSLGGGPCKISSIKLCGKLDRLPDHSELRALYYIKKLQLFSTNLCSDDLSALQKLPGLEYLKLLEVRTFWNNGNFIVKENGFPSLKRLCIDAPRLPKLQFNRGAMKSLISLQLLCPDSSQMKALAAFMGISNLTRLDEVVFKFKDTDDALQAWDTIAAKHPNRPLVKNLQ